MNVSPTGSPASDDCAAFRAELERWLSATTERVDLAPPSWNQHLAMCTACRALLEAEEALEMLLDSLPEPRLPRDLARRVLRRLEAERPVDALDRLLELDETPAAPAGLAAAVLDGLRAERGADSLDQLLDALPTPRVPDSLSRRVLAGLEPARRPRMTLLRGGMRRWAAAAASLAVATGLYVLMPRGSEQPGPGPTVVVDEPDEELLRNLSLFADEWELVVGDEIDPLLGTLSAEEQLWLAALEEEGEAR